MGYPTEVGYPTSYEKAFSMRNVEEIIKFNHRIVFLCVETIELGYPNSMVETLIS